MTTLQELINEIRHWSKREDVSEDQIRSFVGMVEDDFKAEFYFPINETTVNLTTKSNGRVNIPTDFLKMKRIIGTNANGNEYSIHRKPNDVVIDTQGTQGITDLIYFERRGSELFFSPNLGEGVDIELTYYNMIPSLVGGTTNSSTNSILQILPAVYLYGGLMMLHRFTYNEERAQFYERQYEKAKADIIEMQDKAEMAGARMAVVPSIGE